jgi:DNA-binding NtrC family response regulator
MPFRRESAMARVLVVDDEAPIRRAMARVLRRAGHDAVEAEDGAVALAAVKAAPVDLVVTDIVMPEIEGLEFMRKLAQLRPGTKVIAVSGGGVWEAANLLTVAEMLGAVRTLSKPFELKDFLSLVNEVLAPGAS